MKRFTLMAIIVLSVLSCFSQKFQIPILSSGVTYKKHYSANIEGGFANGLQREFIVGNETDWIDFAKKISGQFFTGNILSPGRNASLFSMDDDLYQLTDFDIYPTAENEFAIGTGVYYPNGLSNSAFPFLATYDRKTMEMLSLTYYNISYQPGEGERVAGGTRIKYSEASGAFYISGVMADRMFQDMNLTTLLGKSKGFILKIDVTDMSYAQVLIFDPDQLAPETPVYSAITDLEINDDAKEIAFTGITTENQFNGYYAPVVGKIDLNLNLLWSNTYKFGSDRYSGIDVEYSKDNNLLVLMNNDQYAFSIMELDDFGSVIQQPIIYKFNLGNEDGLPRAHKMHFTGDKIEITGNCFIKTNQHLFGYEIRDASDLSSGDLTFNSYSEDITPIGKQTEVTSFWAPENSIYSGGYLSIVGIYNNLPTVPTTTGYTVIHTAGYEDCLQIGDVTLDHLSTSQTNCVVHLSTCLEFKQPQPQIVIPSPISIQSCPTHEGKSIEIDETTGSLLWQYRGIDESGIHAILNAETQAQYLITVYDITGRKVCNENYTVNGQKDIYLKFHTGNQIYMISVNNGIKTETMKVSGVR